METATNLAVPGKDTDRRRAKSVSDHNSCNRSSSTRLRPQQLHPLTRRPLRDPYPNCGISLFIAALVTVTKRDSNVNAMER